jgi:hypothetical protein
MAFLFYFPYGSQFKLRFKHVQQFKEYLKLSMVQHFITHIVLTK